MADTSYMDKIQAQAFRAGIRKGTEEARKFFASKLKEVKSVNRKDLLKDPNFKVRARPLTGRLFIYFYDPKYKKTLPYYDRFPLTFMVEKAEGGFYGLNLHNTRLKLSYELLKKTGKLKFFKPCFKHYLSEHVRSKIVEIPASEWESILFLPTEYFTKKNKSAVWADSRSSI
jgi:hypothetical protein